MKFFDRVKKDFNWNDYDIVSYWTSETGREDFDSVDALQKKYPGLDDCKVTLVCNTLEIDN